MRDEQDLPELSDRPLHAHAELRSVVDGDAVDQGPASCHGLVGRSPALRRVVEQIMRVARSSAPVLILGETGTGKELIARAIHAGGPRHAAPYVAVNCAALPRDLVESELFGHRRGAFSGALTDHAGLLRAADGGTVLLDEITEMSPDLQAKLLRVVQERSVRPVGALTETPVTVRFIASANRDPAPLLRDGLLRADLYYRLAVSVIVVPPLSERRDDVPLLIEHHLDTLRRRAECPSERRRGITPAALAALVDRPWPGNVRELFNAVEAAFIAAPGRDIEAADLPPTPASAPPVTLTPSTPSRAATTCAQHERALIERVLLAVGGNKARAARQLGISRKRLYARLAQYLGQ